MFVKVTTEEGVQIGVQVPIDTNNPVAEQVFPVLANTAMAKLADMLAILITWPMLTPLLFAMLETHLDELDIDLEAILERITTGEETVFEVVSAWLISRASGEHEAAAFEEFINNRLFENLDDDSLEP